MYDGTDTYDFLAALAEARAHATRRQHARKEAEAMAEADYWEAFASGSLYRQTTYGTGRPAKTKPLGRIVSSTPTAEQLRKHAERFGPEGVAEIAAAYGIDMSAKSIAPKPKRRRRTTPGIKAQVAELHARGMIPAAIADTLNLADRRVKELLAA